MLQQTEPVTGCKLDSDANLWRLIDGILYTIDALPQFQQIIGPCPRKKAINNRKNREGNNKNSLSPTKQLVFLFFIFRASFVFDSSVGALLGG